jgi:hypothetical protein
MSAEPGPAELAAIAAAYAIVRRLRDERPPAPVTPRWRLAARIALADAPNARAAARRSPWRAATAP